MITFIKSFIIGICAILPGVSGSVIAVSLGIYDRFIEVVTNKRKAARNKLFIIINIKYSILIELLAFQRSR